MKKLFLITSLLILSGCTPNIMARNFGGSVDVQVQAGQKVIGATWKGDDLWVLTRPMRTDEKAETCHLTESSSFGVFEGHVRFIEKR